MCDVTISVHSWNSHVLQYGASNDHKRMYALRSDILPKGHPFQKFNATASIFWISYGQQHADVEQFSSIRSDCPLTDYLLSTVEDILYRLGF